MVSSDRNPSRDESAQLVTARLRETGMTGELSYDPEEFQIVTAGDIKSILFLGNVYGEYCSCSNKHRLNSLQRFVRGWLDAHIGAEYPVFVEESRGTDT
jgi:hypothetical protein